nr:hypothetical protein DGKKSRWO_DGKKSRWO_CDS_0169 [uncultured phage]CAI9752348.1 hypothetical protein CVNMHQAP_CVNMHQAP_CDS_0171 [uncultured phage]
MANNIDKFYRQLHKLSPSEVKKYEQDEYDGDVINDGFGNLYLIPDHGVTSLMALSQPYSAIFKTHYKYRYNFDTNEIEIFVLSDSDEYPDVNNYEFIDSYAISAPEFADNSEYWASTAIEHMEDELQSINTEFEAKEAYELYGEIIDEDKEQYSYQIKIDIEVQPKAEDWENLSTYEHEFQTFLSNFEKTIILFSEPVDLTASFDSYLNEITLNVSFTIPLTKDDLLEIYDDIYLDLVAVDENARYTIHINGIDDIIEI